ncbi:hypothetical protein KSMBR1_1550 [Candidatus Kuenenia stuttgartiensis]|uniref:Uncharacterized protein n=2 Tax=Kuenenia stuttgartiensis TaxID=174633 RepID=A0A2C9CDU1_KUEST|nr:hypothetical protein KSMBR1_1550 [Candidatus Kuenenia stuttgartiensis]
MGFYDIIISYDNLLEKFFVVVIDFGMDNTLNDRIGQITEVLCGKSEEPGEVLMTGYDRVVATELRSNFTKDSYMKALRQIKKYISAGDVYQVNLSQRIEAR